jgi:hypothetical protein
MRILSLSVCIAVMQGQWSEGDRPIFREACEAKIVDCTHSGDQLQLPTLFAPVRLILESIPNVLVEDC